MFSWELKLFCLLGRSHRSLHLVSKLTRETGLYASRLNHRQRSLFRQSLCLSAIPYYLCFFFPSGRARQIQFHLLLLVCLLPIRGLFCCHWACYYFKPTDHEEKWRQRREKQEGRNRESRVTRILRSQPNFWTSAWWDTYILILTNQELHPQGTSGAHYRNEWRGWDRQ